MTRLKGLTAWNLLTETKQVLTYIDSNAKHINLYKLFHKQRVNTRRCYTLQQAIDRFNNELPVEGQEPTDIVLHVGTNNLDHDSPQEIVRLMNEFVQCVKNKFPKATIHISEILPRKTASMNSAFFFINRYRIHYFYIWRIWKTDYHTPCYLR